MEILQLTLFSNSISIQEVCETVWCTVLLIVFIGFIVWMIHLKNENYIPKEFLHYPLLKISFDVSGKRLPKIEEYIEGWLLNGGFETIKQNEEKVKLWEQDAEKFIETCSNPDNRRQQYNNILHNNKIKTYNFQFTRKHTVYYQRNNTKYSTIQDVVCDQRWFGYDRILEIYNKATNIK